MMMSKMPGVLKMGFVPTKFSHELFCKLSPFFFFITEYLKTTGVSDFVLNPFLKNVSISYFSHYYSL